MWFNTSHAQRLAVDRMPLGHTDSLPQFTTRLIAELSTAAELAPGDPVYEIAAGSGSLTSALLRFGFNVTASEPRARLRTQLAEFGSPRLAIREASFGQDAIAPGGFAAVFAANTCHWIAPEDALARVTAAVGPGGALILLWSFSFVEARVQAKLNRSAFRPHRALATDPSGLNSIDNAMLPGRQMIADSGLFAELWWNCEPSVRTLGAENFAELAASTRTTSAWTDAERTGLEDLVLSDLDDLGVDAVAITDHIYVLVARTRR